MYTFCRKAVIVSVFALALLCCSRPVKNSAFCNLDPKNGWCGPVSLEIEMTDSINATQLDICFQIISYNIEKSVSVPVVLGIESPSGQQYTDTLLLPLDIIKEKGITYNKSNGYMTLQWPYRKNVITRDPGLWQFTFIPYGATASDGNTPEKDYNIYKKITGIGISCKQEGKQ